MNAKERVERLLEEAGVTPGGPNPWDVHIRDDRLYSRILAGGSLALGESYMDRWWDAPALDQFLDRLLSAHLEKKVRSSGLLWLILQAKLLNRQDRRHAFDIGERHYDVGNDLYEAMLDKRMVYTCGYWSGVPRAKDIDEAQEAKLDLVCRKIGLRGGERVLDIGGGWGSFARFAAERYGAHVTAITVSKEQIALGKERTKGLPVEIRLQDYRDVTERFDHVVSLGMYEHVGYKNYEMFMGVVSRVLKDDGLFLLHTIGNNRSVYAGDPWVDRYIFPGGMLPSVAQIGSAIENLFVMEDWHNFGSDYDKTLMQWFKNFDKAWSSLQGKYSERFYYMWKYYLLASAATFRARKNQLWQIVLSKKGLRGGYISVR